MAEIYCIENKINHKKYIGETMYTCEERGKGHLRTGKNPRPRDLKRPLYKAFTKYGIENFRLTLLEECPFEQRFEREQYGIEKLDTVAGHNKGYNLTLGGESGRVKVNEDIFMANYEKAESKLELAALLNCSMALVNKYLKQLNLTKFGHLKRESPIAIEAKIKWDKVKDYVINKYYTIPIMIKDLAAELEVCDDTLRKHFKEWGVKTIIKKKLFLTEDEQDEVLEKYDELRHIKKTAEYFDCAPETISAILKLHGYVFDNHYNTQVKPVEVDYNGQIYKFKSRAEAARGVIDQGGSSSSVDAINANIGRVINGKRGSYLGLKGREPKD